MADEPDSKPDSSGQRRRVYGLIAVLILVIGIVAGGWWMAYQASADRPLDLAQTAYFEIGKGEGLPSIAKRLEAQGVVEALRFEALVMAEGAKGRLKYGEYEISPGISLRGLLDKFIAGRVRQHAVTIVEGWNFAETLAALARHPALVAEVAGQPADQIMIKLGTPGLPPEGRFFPDTYFVIKGTTDLDVLKRAYGKMRTVLDQEWRNRAEPLPLRSPDEALTLASIVEKETARPEERPAVAGVFVRRLLKGMRLQTDPTVIYGMGAAYAGNITKDDLRRDTPYNTYTRAGLPPTPIALPGLPAIRAALHPDSGNSLYFVSRGNGSHVFSATLDEHQRAVD
ncbi:endolytic transglycosylase MltG, partial [Methylomagnum sp.]